MKKVLLVLITATLAMSCATRIGDVKLNPSKYVGEVVTVKGEITKLVNIPFTDYSFFELSDKSDNITVFTLKDHKKGEIIKFNAEVVGYDSTNQEKSTLAIIQTVEDFIIQNIKIDEDKIKSHADTIGRTLTKALDVTSGTYLLIEQDK